MFLLCGYLLASESLSHRHFTEEPATPEDMSHEHVYHHGQYLWDMHVLGLGTQIGFKLHHS